MALNRIGGDAKPITAAVLRPKCRQIHRVPVRGTKERDRIAFQPPVNGLRGAFKTVRVQNRVALFDRPRSRSIRDGIGQRFFRAFKIALDQE